MIMESTVPDKFIKIVNDTADKVLGSESASIEWDWSHKLVGKVHKEVKIPITNTKAESSVKLIDNLSNLGVSVNVTAMMTVEQVQSVLPALSKGPGGYVSVFAGRIADAGNDPLPVMSEIVDILKDYPNIELIWASPRELYNVVQADNIGCHIITATNNILKKLPTLGKNLDQFSLETVQMFYDDAQKASYSI